MENKINIAEILRDMPQGTKLYSPLFGKCEYISVVGSKRPINIRTNNTTDMLYEALTEYGCYFSDFEDADTVLFPSAKMRCWGKFFKRGDVVYNPGGEIFTIFEGWANDDYTEFNTTIDYYKISDSWGKGDICCTSLFRKATDEERAEFIAAAEKHFGGKYNPETLQVEPVEPVKPVKPVKVVEPKCSFMPFQEVLVRDSDAGIWKAAHFSHYIGEYEYPYFTTASAYKQCVPYDCNEYLLGTNKSPE